MEYSFKSDNFTTKSFNIKQFENCVTTLKFSHPNIVDGTNITALTPMLIVSTGDIVPVGDELNYTSEADYMTASWLINERYTQRAGSFFIQLAFADDENNIKLYSEKLMMIVEPSIDYQRDFLEYNPLFMERFKQEILGEILEKIPTKTSDLQNDSGYLSKERDLAHFATNEYVDSLVQKFATKSTPRQVIKFTAPINTSKVVENVDVEFDSTGKYVKTVFIALDSNGNGFSLNDAAIYIKRAVVMGKSVDVRVYANAADINSEGTLLINSETFMEQTKTVVGSITASRIHDRWKIECMRQEKDNGERNSLLIRTDTAVLTDETITSLKIEFTPDSTPTTNILTGTTFELWGTDA